jgi:hypothetical protein
MEDLPHYLQPLEFLTVPFPAEAVRIAIERREETTPYLLRALEWANANPEAANEGEEPYMLHLFALYLLAEFREPKAFAPVVQLFRNPEYEALTGDIVADDLGRILASISGGAPEPIKAVAEDPSLNEWVRSAALHALAVMVHSGLWQHSELSAYFDELFKGRLEREPSYVWDQLCATCADFGMVEHLPSIRLAYAEECADATVDLLDDLERELRRPKGTSKRVDWSHYEVISNTIAEMEGWSCFKTKKQHRVDEAKAAARRAAALSRMGVPASGLKKTGDEDGSSRLVRATDKVGRNDPCPCKSGKKYKKCCGAHV